MVVARGAGLLANPLSTPWLAYINWAARTHLLGIRGYGAWPGSEPEHPVELRGRMPDQRAHKSSARFVIGITHLP